MPITEKILIAETNNELRFDLADELDRAGYVNVDAVSTHDSMRRALEREFYNIIIADGAMLTYEDITYIKEGNPHTNDYPYSSETILLCDKNSADADEFVTTKAVNIINKPVDYSILMRVITSRIEHQRFKAANARIFGRDATIERGVTAVMHGLGIPAHIKGYQFLRTAITKTIYDPDMINYVTKSLYPTVAKIHSTTPSRVERAIRHAIEVAWDRGDVETLTSYFGYTISRQRGKPTNSEFIAMIADNLRMKNSDILGDVNEAYAMRA
jgi:two-component system response regulator (stage 0 sporulation protein A)